MQKNLSKSKIAKILRELVFDPKLPGPMRIICDMEDSRYYRQRAIEEICEASSCFTSPEAPSEHTKKAIQLLVLSLV